MKKKEVPEVAVIILNYNGKNWLEKFLPSVIQYTPATLAKIWVADNASTDGSLEMIQANFKEVSTLSIYKNLGFAEGYNQAISKIPCKYVLLLNSDVEVTENWLEPLYYSLERNRKAAACQPKLLNYNCKESFEYAGAGGGFLDKYGYPFCRGRIFDVMEEDHGQYDDEIEVFWASGACMLVRKNLFVQSGGFDKDFFAHMEEIDICWRFKRLGYQIRYIPTSTVYHVGGGTLNAQNHFKTYLNFRNNRLMLFKNLDTGQAIQMNLVRNLMDLMSLITFLLKFKWKDAGAVIKAQWDYRKMMPSAMKKRNHFLSVVKDLTIDKPNTKGRYPKSIVFSYFIKRVKKFSQLTW